MTLGEKIKEARKTIGLSQEGLAAKLCVSRQAITKWESDKGLPDIPNLKALAELLGVSVDYLLDDGSSVEMNVIKEAIDWEKHPKVKGNALREDAVVLDCYPDALSITQLRRDKKRTKGEVVVDELIGWLSPLPFGMSQEYDRMRDPSIYYLVETLEGLMLVNVGKEFIISRRLLQKSLDKKFEIGGNVFRKTLRKLKTKNKK